jgi:hypothetical protein
MDSATPDESRLPLSLALELRGQKAFLERVSILQIASRRSLTVRSVGLPSFLAISGERRSARFQSRLYGAQVYCGVNVTEGAAALSA